MLNGRMKFLSRCIHIIGLSALLFSLHAEQPSPEVLAAAQSGLPVMLNGINKPEVLAQFNFAAGEDITTSTLGAPFFLRTITPAALETYTKGTNIASLLSPTGMWYFPVIYKNDIRLFMTVAEMNGEWKAVSIGIGPLAKKMNKVLDAWPAKNGHSPILVQIFETHEYFFIVPNGKSNNFTPVFPMSFAKDENSKPRKPFASEKGSFAELDNADDVVDELLPAVRKAMSAGKR